jgi:hypothetical protein
VKAVRWHLVSRSPSTRRKRIADELIATGTGSHGFLGARIADDQLIDNADALVTTMHAEAPGATIAVNYLDPSGLRALQRSCSERIRVSGENR